MVSFVDETEQKKLEETINQSEKAAVMGMAVRDLAHELKNPLSVVSSCAQFCMESMELPSHVNENLQMIFRNSKRANKLIKDLHKFVKTTADAIPKALKLADDAMRDKMTESEFKKYQLFQKKYFKLIEKGDHEGAEQLKQDYHAESV